MKYSIKLWCVSTASLENQLSVFVKKMYNFIHFPGGLLSYLLQKGHYIIGCLESNYFNICLFFSTPVAESGLKLKKIKNKSYKEKKLLRKPSYILPDISPDFLVLFGVFLISLSIISLEISITRISSIIYTYNYAFMSVSLAILGLGLGGIFSYYRWSSRKVLSVEFIYDRLSLYSTLFSLFVLLFVVSVLKIPLFANLFFYFVITFLPFFFAFLLFPFLPKSAKILPGNIQQNAVSTEEKLSFLLQPTPNLLTLL